MPPKGASSSCPAPRTARLRAGRRERAAIGRANNPGAGRSASARRRAARSSAGRCYRAARSSAPTPASETAASRPRSRPDCRAIPPSARRGNARPSAAFPDASRSARNRSRALLRTAHRAPGHVRPPRLRELPDALVDRFLEVALAVQVVRPCGRVLELQWPVVGLPVLLDRLEQDEWVAAAVAQLVLGQVRGNRVDPGGELLRLVEAVQMPEYPDEHLLYQVFGALPVPDRAVDEVEQSGLVAVDERAECLGVPRQVLEHQPAVVQLVERLALPRAWGGRGWGLLFEGCSHDSRLRCFSQKRPGPSRG